MIMLGNVKFEEIEDYFGYKLTEDDKKLWDTYHNDKADLSGKESSFHCFDIPRCITVKGEAAKKAVLKIFSPEKIVKATGRFPVYEVSK